VSQKQPTPRPGPDNPRPSVKPLVISGDAFAGKPAHTPGPWKVYPKGVLNPGFQVCDRIVAEKYNGGDSKSPSDANAKLIAAAPDFLEAAKAAVAYDAAIQSAANDPEKMSSLCTAEGEDLDLLYARWISLSRAALAKAGV
jgi:hypothetical protein